MPETPKTKPCPRCLGTKRYNKKPCALCKARGTLDAAARRPIFDTVTHVAGGSVEIHGRVLQRCCVCGGKIMDALVRDQPVDARGKARPVFTWAPGDFVQLNLEPDAKGLLKLVMTGHYSSDPLPADFCIDLVE